MHTCTTRRRNRCPRLVLGRFVRGPRQRLNFENQDEEEDEVVDDDLYVHVQDDSDPDVTCGQPSNPARQRLQNRLMQKKARTPRAWKTLETCRSIDAALDLVGCLSAQTMVGCMLVSAFASGARHAMRCVWHWWTPRRSGEDLPNAEGGAAPSAGRVYSSEQLGNAIGW